MFSHVNFLRLRAHYVSKGTGELPRYVGSALRGSLGHSVREFACTAVDHEQKCFLCDKRADCNYAKFFCSVGTSGGTSGPENPFVLRALMAGKTAWRVGDPLDLELTLIGEAARAPSIYMDALQGLGRRGLGGRRIPFELQQIVDADARTLVYCAGKTFLRNAVAHPLLCEARPARAALVRFDTPVRILSSKVLLESLSFEDLIRSLSRRLSLLSRAYTDQIINWDEAEMLKAARGVRTASALWRKVDFERYSMTHAATDHKLALPAIEGWALYEGELEPFTPILEAGRILHAGKNATIGFGHYEVVYDR